MSKKCFALVAILMSAVTSSVFADEAKKPVPSGVKPDHELALPILDEPIVEQAPVPVEPARPVRGLEPKGIADLMKLDRTVVEPGKLKLTQRLSLGSQVGNTGFGAKAGYDFRLQLAKKGRGRAHIEAGAVRADEGTHAVGQFGALVSVGSCAAFGATQLVASDGQYYRIHAPVFLGFGLGAMDDDVYWALTPDFSVVKDAATGEWVTGLGLQLAVDTRISDAVSVWGVGNIAGANGDSDAFVSLEGGVRVRVHSNLELTGAASVSSRFLKPGASEEDTRGEVRSKTAVTATLGAALAF